MSNPPPRPPRVPPPVELPPLSETSPKISTAQRFLENRADKKLFDSADYFSVSPSQRAIPSTLINRETAFDQVSHETQRIHKEVEPRSSTLSFELFTNVDDSEEVTGDVYSDPSIDGDSISRKSSSNLRRSSMEELFVEENPRATVKHALMQKPQLKRWDSGDFYSSPEDYRRMLATQAKEVLRQALDHAEEDHRPRRARRSSLSHELDNSE